MSPESVAMIDELTQQCAANVMETFHLMMGTVGREAGKQPTDDVAMHQFRALMTIRHHEGASLSEVAEHLGATLSAASCSARPPRTTAGG
jgi:DNA-binding MarR family transcriptional regulator